MSAHKLTFSVRTSGPSDANRCPVSDCRLSQKFGVELHQELFWSGNLARPDMGVSSSPVSAPQLPQPSLTSPIMRMTRSLVSGSRARLEARRVAFVMRSSLRVRQARPAVCRSLVDSNSSVSSCQARSDVWGIPLDSEFLVSGRRARSEV